MKSILLSVLILTASAACAQDIPMPAAPVSPTPIGKVRKIYVGMDLHHGRWSELSGNSKPRGRFAQKLAKDLAGTCLEIAEDRSEADATLEIDARVAGAGGSVTSCTSSTMLGSASCSGGGIRSSVVCAPSGCSSWSGPDIIPVFVLEDKTGSDIGNWSFEVKVPGLFEGPRRGLAKSLLNAVGCGSDDRQWDAK